MNVLDEIQKEVSTLRENHKNDFHEIKSLLTRLLGQEKYYSIQEFSDKLGIHYQTTRNAILDGRIKAKKFGSRRIMIHSSELNRVMSDIKSLKYRRNHEK